MLLVWAANVIKAYAASKWLGIDPSEQPPMYSNLQPTFKKRDLQQITIETKIAMRQKKRTDTQAYLQATKSRRPKREGETDDEDLDEGADDDEDEAARRKREEERKKRKAQREVDKVRSNQKVGKYGYVLEPKPMLYDPDNDAMVPARGSSKPKRIADLNILRAGANAVTETTTKKRKEEFMKEDVFLNAEEDRLGKKAREEERLRKLEEAKKQEADKDKIQKQKEIMKGGEKKKVEEPEGKLKIAEVENLPDEVDDIIKQINDIDFGVQDLDVLIALSKTLKTKRINLFPESQYAFNLQETGLTNEEFEKANQDGDAL